MANSPYPQPNGSTKNFCVDSTKVNVWFAPNGASSPTSFGGPFVTGVTRNAAGLLTITLVGFVPKSILEASIYGFDNANADDTMCTIGATTITAATKTVTVKVGTRTAAGVAKDIAANAASIVKLALVFKTFPGNDATGL
jgi:hypothetical protein